MKVVARTGGPSEPSGRHRGPVGAWRICAKCSADDPRYAGVSHVHEPGLATWRTRTFTLSCGNCGHTWTSTAWRAQALPTPDL